MSLPGFTIRSLGCWLLLVAALALAGCATWDKRPAERAAEAPPEAEKDGDWSASLRAPGPTGQQLGIDPRAREIERHLGVR